MVFFQFGSSYPRKRCRDLFSREGALREGVCGAGPLACAGAPAPALLYPCHCMASPLIDYDCYLRLARSRDFLAAHSCRRIRVPDAAREAGISLHHYIRLYARAFGETPQEFVMRQRLETAQRLLRGGSLSVTDVCLEVGYESLGTFSTLFHRTCGVSPARLSPSPVVSRRRLPLLRA